MHVVTAGKPYMDIDAYAGCIAYAELLQKKGIDAVAASSSTINASVPATIQSWHGALLTNYQPTQTDTFTIIDTSNPKFLDAIVDPEHVTEVIDHHVSFEAYWREKLGKKANIEFVGAACTQVYEKWHQAGLVADISPLSAKLLICGILDNTLNFQANITTERDKQAYDFLLSYAQLPSEWPVQYFAECQATIASNIADAIQNDTKVITFQGLDGPITVGQLTVWNAKSIAAHEGHTIQAILSKQGSPWFMNLISIAENKSYFFCEDPKIRTWLSNLLQVEFRGSLGRADRLWLRKEIIKRSTD